MAYENKAHKRFTVAPRFWGGIEQQTLTGNLVLTLKSATFLSLDPGGSARDVTLPAEADSKGLIYSFYNAADAPENLVVKDDGGSTIVTIAQAGAAIVGCDGSSWFRVG